MSMTLDELRARLGALTVPGDTPVCINSRPDEYGPENIVAVTLLRDVCEGLSVLIESS